MLGWASTWVASWTVRMELRAAAEPVVRRHGLRFERERNRREVVACAADGRRVRWTPNGVDLLLPGTDQWRDVSDDPAWIDPHEATLTRRGGTNRE